MVFVRKAGKSLIFLEGICRRAIFNERQPYLCNERQKGFKIL